MALREDHTLPRIIAPEVINDFPPGTFSLQPAATRMERQNPVTAHALTDAFDEIGVVPTVPTFATRLVASLHGVPHPVEDAGIVREQGRVVALDRQSGIAALPIFDHIGLIHADDRRVTNQLPNHPGCP